MRSWLLVFFVQVACSLMRTTSLSVISQSRNPSSLAAVGVDGKTKESSDLKRHRATDYSKEPAGAAHIFSKPRSVRDSLRRGRRRATKFVRNRTKKWIIRRGRHRRDEYVVDVTDDLQSALEELDIPKWACVDENERYRLATMKALLQTEFELLSDRTVQSQHGSHIHVVKAFPDVYGDLRLLRFLRKDKVQNPASAASRYRSFIKWRMENDVDVVRFHVETQSFSPPSQLDIMNDLLPCNFNVNEGGDADTVVALLHVGRWDTAAISKLIQEKKLSVSCFLLYWTHIFESINRKLHDEMMSREKMVYVDEICDLDQMSMRQFSPAFVSNVLKPWLKLTQGNYPETTKRIVFLNPPKIISIIWNIVAPMASPGTVAKVQFKRDFKGSCIDYLRDN